MHHVQQQQGPRDSAGDVGLTNAVRSEGEGNQGNPKPPQTWRGSDVTDN